MNARDKGKELRAKREKLRRSRSIENVGPAITAVSTLGWRWIVGMRWVLTESKNKKQYGRITSFEDNIPTGALPDFYDPATFGCLLYLVREFWGETTYSKVGKDGKWEVFCGAGTKTIAAGYTESDALIEALRLGAEAERAIRISVARECRRESP
jgi:hypothetical protein